MRPYPVKTFGGGPPPQQEVDFGGVQEDEEEEEEEHDEVRASPSLSSPLSRSLAPSLSLALFIRGRRRRRKCASLPSEEGTS